MLNMPVIMYKKIYPKTVLFYFFVLWGVTSLQTWGQTPTASLTLDKISISEAGGKATLTATLSAPHSRDVTVYLKTAGTATYQVDYEADFVGKGTAKTVAGGNGRGSAANQLSSPRGIFVDSQGNLFIADEVNSRIQKWALGATLGITVAGGNGMGFDANQISYPNDVFLDIKGDLWIVDTFKSRIQKWVIGARSGITIIGDNGTGSAANQLFLPEGIFVDSQSNLFISDLYNNRVQKWEPSAVEGITVAGGNGLGSGSNQLYHPSDLYLDSQHNLFIVDRFNNRIQKWLSGATIGVTVAGGNGEGSDSNQLDLPSGICVDSLGNMFITDTGNDRVQKWSPGATSGVTVAGGNGIGSASNQLSYPTGIFVDSQGNLFISDTSNDRIQKVVYQPQIIIPAGQTSGTMTVTALADSVGEEDELAIFEILGIENGTVSPNQPVLQVIIGSLPPQPAAFTASKEVVCRSTSFTYTIPAVDRATSYKWSFTEATPNATIAATSSTSATVTFGAGFTGATLNVVASNAYGDSPKRSISIQVGSAPAQPGVISASNSVVCQGSSRTYSIASVSGASSYVWSYTGTGATFSSTGTSAQVTYGASATGGEFRVQAVGACGTSTARTIAVSVIPQRPVLNGLLTIGRTQRRSEQATRSIILEPSVSKPITIEAGAVFSAQIVGCPN